MQKPARRDPCDPALASGFNDIFPAFAAAPHYVRGRSRSGKGVRPGWLVGRNPDDYPIRETPQPW